MNHEKIALSLSFCISPLLRVWVYPPTLYGGENLEGPPSISETESKTLQELEGAAAQSSSALGAESEAAKLRSAQGFGELMGRTDSAPSVSDSHTAKSASSAQGLQQTSSGSQGGSAKSEVPGVYAAKEVYAAKGGGGGIGKALKHPPASAALFGLGLAAVGFMLGGPIGAVFGLLAGFVIGAGFSHLF